MTNVFPKDPDAVLDYQWDWSDWLADGETITAAVIDVPDDLTLDSQEDTDTTVTAWLSDGVTGAGYKLTCHITTSEGRTDDRSIYIKCQER
jgi:hypothetical protein